MWEQGWAQCLPEEEGEEEEKEEEGEEAEKVLVTGRAPCGAPATRGHRWAPCGTVKGPEPGQQLGGEHGDLAGAAPPNQKQAATGTLALQGRRPLTSESEQEGSSPRAVPWAPGPQPGPPSPCCLQVRPGSGCSAPSLRLPGTVPGATLSTLKWCPAQLLAHERHSTGVGDSGWGRLEGLYA